MYALNFAIVPSTRRDLAIDASADSNVGSDASADSNVGSDSRSALGMDCGMAVMYSLGDAGPGTFYEESGQRIVEGKKRRKIQPRLVP